MKLRLLPLLLVALLPACSREGAIMDGGIYVTRSACPTVGIPAGTGDITLFDPAGRTDASAIDVTATITNLRGYCEEAGDQIVSTATFDVVAVRREAGPARQVVLPFFSTVVRAGNQVVAKRVGHIALNFEAGSLRARTNSQGSAQVHRSAAALPADVVRTLTRPRRPGDPSAAVDPLADPAVRTAVANASFEHLVGFQLSQQQLRYNVTR